LLSDSIDQHKGKVVHYAGDAVLAKFGASDRHSASGKYHKRLAAGNTRLYRECELRKLSP
jgi:class 3 adenylate cyclase